MGLKTVQDVVYTAVQLSDGKYGTAAMSKSTISSTSYYRRALINQSME